MILEAAQVKQIQLWWLNIFPSSSISHLIHEHVQSSAFCWGLKSRSRSMNEHNLNVSSKSSSFSLPMNFFSWCPEIFRKVHKALCNWDGQDCMHISVCVRTCVHICFLSFSFFVCVCVFVCLCVCAAVQWFWFGPTSTDPKKTVAVQWC